MGLRASVFGGRDEVDESIMKEKQFSPIIGNELLRNPSCLTFNLLILILPTFELYCVQCNELWKFLFMAFLFALGWFC